MHRGLQKERKQSKSIVCRKTKCISPYRSADTTSKSIHLQSISAPTSASNELSLLSMVMDVPLQRSHPPSQVYLTIASKSLTISYGMNKIDQVVHLDSFLLYILQKLSYQADLLSRIKCYYHQILVKIIFSCDSDSLLIEVKVPLLLSDYYVCSLILIIEKFKAN